MISQLELTRYTDCTELEKHRNEAIERLLALGLSPLPVAPLQDADLYPARDQKGRIIVNKDGTFKPLFNGKNPSYLDSDGIPHIIQHSDFQHRQPTQAELDLWFCNKQTGLGYLHTSIAPNLRTQDIDQKDFQNISDCYRSLSRLLQFPEFEGADIQGSISGGYHLLIECEAEFTNFKFKDFESKTGKHGELLGVGRFVVCFPTPGYTILNAGSPVRIESLEKFGIISTKSATAKSKAIDPVIAMPGAAIAVVANKVVPVKVEKPIQLYRLLSKPTKSYVNGENGHKGDRSHLLTRVRNECAGWVNWCSRNNVPLIDDSAANIALAAKNLGIDEERKNRILKKLKPLSECIPPIFSYRGDEGCWYVIKKLLGLKVDSKKWAIDIHHGKRAKRRVFSADEQINQQFLEKDILINALKSADIVALKSPMGTGKTEVLIPVRSAYSDTGGALIGSRNSLLIQTTERLSVEKPLYHLQTDDAKQFTSDLYSWLTLCVDSLHNYSDPSQFDDQVLILDEVVSTMGHALLSPTIASQKGGRPLHLMMFEEAIKRAKKIILLDGNLDDQTCEWIRAIRAKGDRDATMLKIENTFKPVRKAIQLVSTIENDSDKPFDMSPLLRHIKTVLDSHKSLESGAKAIAFISDSQFRLERVDRWLSKAGYKILRIDSKTIENSDIREILKNPNEAIEREQYDAVLLSPTVEMGLDISIKNYFVAGFAGFCGLLSTNSQTQFLNRFRDCQNWFIHCVKQTNLQQYKELADIVSVVEMCVRKSWDGENQTAILGHALKSLEIAKNSIHYSFTEAILEDLIHERRNSYDCLNEELRKSHDVSEIEAESCDWERGENKIIGEEIREEESTRIFDAATIGIDEARELSKKLGKSEKERAEIDRAFILDRLPGIEESHLWDSELINHLKFEDRFKDVKKLERFWLTSNLSDAKLISQRSLAGSMSDDDQSVKWRRLKSFCPWDIRSDFATCSAIADLGLHNLLDGRAYRADSPEIVKIIEAIKNSDDYRKLFSVKPSEPPMRTIGLIFDLIGIKSDSKKITIEGTDKRCLEYSYYALTDERSTVILECISQRMNERLKNHEGERYEMPVDADFEIDTLCIEGVPNIKQWMSKADIANIEMLWKSAIESLAEFGSKDPQIAVKKVVISLWNAGRLEVERVVDEIMAGGF